MTDSRPLNLATNNGLRPDFERISLFCSVSHLFLWGTFLRGLILIKFSFTQA